MRAGLIGVLLAAAAAQAGNPAQEAKEHYERGQAHYNLGEWADAAKEYKEAYRIKPVPALLFNIAQAYRQAEDWKNAAFFYKQYLKVAPENVANRGIAEQMLKAVEERLAPPPAAPAAPAAPAPVAAPVSVAAPTPAPAPLSVAAPAPVAAPVSVAAPAPAPVTEPAPVAPPPVVIRKAPEPEPPAPSVALAPPAPAPEAPPAAPAAATTPPAQEKELPWAGLVAGGGVTTALVGGAIATFMIANQNVNSLAAAPHSRAEADRILNDASVLQSSSLAMAVAAAVAAGTTAFLALYPADASR